MSETTFNIRKEKGITSRKNKAKKTRTGPSRSDYNYGKIDKARGLRKKADRHSHHRRRNHVRNQLAKGTLDSTTMAPPSSTKNSGSWGSHSNKISNRKRL